MKTRTRANALRRAVLSAVIVVAGCGDNAEPSAVTTLQPPSTTLAAASDGTISEAATSAWMVIQVSANGRAEIRLVDRDGNEVGSPGSDVPGGDQTNPDWSPDGETLTFGMTGDDGRDDLWVVDVDGVNPSMLYDCSGECRYIDDPAWSHDGSSIAVCIMRSIDGADLGRLALIEVASGQLTELTSFKDTQFCSGARWSPDDSQIVVEVVERSGTTMSDDVTGVVLSIVDVATGTLVRALTDPATFAATADWSAVTDQIVYSALLAAGANSPDLFAVRPDGSAPERLTTVADAGGAAQEPSISGDGASVVFVSSGSVSGLAQLDLTTGTVEQAFTEAVGANHPRHRPGTAP